MEIIFRDVCYTVMKYENIYDFHWKKAPSTASTAVAYMPYIPNGIKAQFQRELTENKDVSFSYPNSCSSKFCPWTPW